MRRVISLTGPMHLVGGEPRLEQRDRLAGRGRDRQARGVRVERVDIAPRRRRRATTRRSSGSRAGLRPAGTTRSRRSRSRTPVRSVSRSASCSSMPRSTTTLTPGMLDDLGLRAERAPTVGRRPSRRKRSPCSVARSRATDPSRARCSSSRAPRRLRDSAHASSAALSQ